MPPEITGAFDRQANEAVTVLPTGLHDGTVESSQVMLEVIDELMAGPPELLAAVILGLGVFAVQAVEVWCASEYDGDWSAIMADMRRGIAEG